MSIISMHWCPICARSAPTWRRRGQLLPCPRGRWNPGKKSWGYKIRPWTYVSVELIHTTCLWFGMVDQLQVLKLEWLTQLQSVSMI